MPTPSGVNYLLQFLNVSSNSPIIWNKNQKWTFCLMSYSLLSVHWHICFYVIHYLYVAPLTSVLAEQVGVSACISHQQHKFPIILIPDKKPVRSDVAFPVAFELAMKNVRSIFLWKFTFCWQDVKDFCQLMLVVASFEATFQRTLELASIAQRVLHALHWFIKSSTLLAS